MALAQQDKTRPFLSVIISCYNSKKTIGRVLQNLTNQLSYDDLEVIISDDCSTEPYDDIIEEYKEQLNIVTVKTDYNCCPSNTRQAGLQAATGQWICFSDHDDIFIPGSLQILKDKIENELDERYYIITGFVNENQYRDNKEAKNVKATETSGWTHGKFYNLDNLIKKFDLHFKEDLLSHEDVYFTTSVNCALEFLHSKHIDAGIYLDDLFTYVWYSHPGSLSHTYENYDYLEEHFIEYGQATGEVYLDNYFHQRITWTRAKECLIDAFLLYYFYNMSFLYYNPLKYKKTNITYVQDFYKRIKDIFNLSAEEIWMKASENNCYSYKQAEKYSEIGTGNIIPPLSLQQWLDMITHPDEEPRTFPLYSPYCNIK